jgi:hypothetical protein
MTGACHHTQFLLVEMGSWELFAQIGLKNINPLNISICHIARITGLSYHTWLSINFQQAFG